MTRTFSFGMPSVFARSSALQRDHLVRGPERELVAVPRGDGRVRLHHRVRLVRRRVGRVELDRRRGEGAGEVADRACRAARRTLARRLRRVLAPRRGRTRPSRARTRRAPGAPPRAPARTSRPRRPRSPGGSAGSPGRRAACAVLKLPLPSLPAFSRRDDRDHAGRGLRGGEVHRDDAALGDGRADDVAVGLVRDDVVPVVGVRRGAGRLERAVDAVDGLADDLQLVDRVRRGGRVEFHASALSLRRGPRRACARPAAP